VKVKIIIVVNPCQDGDGGRFVLLFIMIRPGAGLEKLNLQMVNWEGVAWVIPRPLPLPTGLPCGLAQS